MEAVISFCFSFLVDVLVFIWAGAYNVQCGRDYCHLGSEFSGACALLKSFFFFFSFCSLAITFVLEFHQNALGYDPQMES